MGKTHLVSSPFLISTPTDSKESSEEVRNQARDGLVDSSSRERDMEEEIETERCLSKKKEMKRRDGSFRCEV